jgi:predicted DNA-binding protein (UPF0251 family)/predicted Fe-Mo cluster-binding NifX family protein
MAAPNVTYYKPRSVPLGELDEVCLSIDGFEALRLADYMGLSHEEAAVAMGVSRQTFGRMLSKSHRCVAKVLAEGLALKIQGGYYTLTESKRQQSPASQPYQCHSDTSAVFETSCDRNSKTKRKERIVAKIAISSEGPSLDEALDPRFGRAAGFIVVDPQTFDFEYVDNGSSQAMAQGAGVQAAEHVANSGAKIVLTGYVGPKAFKALQAVGIRVAQNLADMTVREAIEMFVNDKVEWAQQPNRQGRGR